MSDATIAPNRDDDADQAADILIQLITDVLAPLFRHPDPALARLAALQAIMAHDVRNAADLIAAGQLVALSLSSLVALSEAAGAPAPNLALRLRANANAMIRSQERIMKRRAEQAAQDRMRWGPETAQGTGAPEAGAAEPMMDEAAQAVASTGRPAAETAPAEAEPNAAEAAQAGRPERVVAVAGAATPQPGDSRALNQPARAIHRPFRSLRAVLNEATDPAIAARELSLPGIEAWQPSCSAGSAVASASG